ncbi:DUF1566 domain-containing protein [Candidatus Manganitrophus noduliformans]|uniref:Lcl C-terminal domain-containing protein n=1 Tax=Candidatus Manganitrophus noduliformans TaxID=2606439 RepID=UPI003BEF0A93
MWERSPDITEHPWNWDGASSAPHVCVTKTTGTRGGWRLPSIQELQSLYPLGSGHPFQNVQLKGYWSATTDIGWTTSAWVSSPSPSGVAWGIYDKNAKFYVWCVRGGSGLDAQ